MSIPADAIGPRPPTGQDVIDGLQGLAGMVRARTRKSRYLRGWLLSVLAVWLVSGLSLLVLPARYVSQWTFILPAANSGATVALDTIGQTTTNPGQPFGSVALSPKVIYKEILRSEQVLRGAAVALGLPEREVGRPRVKLIDETSLMLCTVTGTTPEEAQRRARAIIAKFNAQLDVLRRDEVEKRAESVRESLASYQQRLDVSRTRILAAQTETGVVSINQFNEATTSIELIRRRLADLHSDLGKLEAEEQQMTARLGLKPEVAAMSLKIIADPAFARLADEFATANAQFTQVAARLGPTNPVYMEARQKRVSMLGQLAGFARRAGFDDRIPLDKLALMVNNSHQAELIKTLVSIGAQIEGRRREISGLQGELEARRTEMKTVTASSARLEDLKKDHLVAEAVLTSAIARLDTNKTDVFASYPMVQVLAEPDLDERDYHPLLIYVILAAAFGTVMLTIAWGLAWLRPTLIGSASKRG